MYKPIFFILGGMFLCLPLSAHAATIFLTTTGSQTYCVPSNWNDSNNSIEVIGGGAGGQNGVNGGYGGGGGGYTKVTNVSLPAGQSVNYYVGQGGNEDTNGFDTFFCNSTSNCAIIAGSAVVAGAKGGTSGGAGGAAASGIPASGSTRYSGGAGGTANVGG